MMPAIWRDRTDNLIAHMSLEPDTFSDDELVQIASQCRTLVTVIQAIRTARHVGGPGGGVTPSGL